MKHTVCRWSAFVVTAALVALAGCDNSPNPNFEQVIKDRQAARAGDPYSSLSNTPQQYRYLRVEGPLRQGYASQEALSLRANYESMLGKLDAEPEVPGTEELLALCRASFSEVVAFNADSNLNAQNAAPAASAVTDRLRKCRDQAVAAAQSGNESLKDFASLLRRFASTGMVLAGLTAVGRGDETSGLELWRKATVLVTEDRPGFEVRVESFRYR